MSKRKYSPETKAAAMAALLAGQSLDSVADQYQIPRSTLDSWKNPRRPKKFETQKESEIAELLVTYLRANLMALTAQAEVFTNRDWLSEQGASEAAVLHGVMTDKAVRLLEAFGRANDSDTDAGH